MGKATTGLPTGRLYFLPTLRMELYHIQTEHSVMANSLDEATLLVETELGIKPKILSGSVNKVVEVKKRGLLLRGIRFLLYGI